MRGAYGDGLVPANPVPRTRCAGMTASHVGCGLKSARTEPQVRVKRQLTLTLQVTGHDMVLGFTGWQDRQGGRDLR